MENKLPKTQRQIQKNQTRKRLIETALELYAKQGIIATKTSDISKAAQVSHGTLFSHFSTQEALIIAVIEEFGERVTLRLHELVTNNNNLRGVLEAHLQGLTEYEEFYTRLVIERRLLPEIARDTLIIIQSSISFHINQAAEREMKEGTICPYPFNLLFNTWIGLIHYYLSNNDLFAPGTSVIDRYGQELLEHYMSMISSKT